MPSKERHLYCDRYYREVIQYRDIREKGLFD